MTTKSQLLLIVGIFVLPRGNCSNDRGLAWSCDDLESIHSEIQDNYVSYSFRITPTPGNFEKSRLLCNEMGGDLITHNLDHQGSSRHDEIRRLVEKNINDKHLWIGMNDRGQDGDFRLTNGTSYDATDMSELALYRWHYGQPDNDQHVSDISGIDEDCVHIIRGFSDGEISLNDYPCNMDYWHDDASQKFYGLCEIITYKCAPSL